MVKKGKVIIERIKEKLTVNDNLDFKQLEKDRIVLVYLSRTYRNFCPYLKAVHQNLNFQRSGRDSAGRNFTLAELMKAMKNEVRFENFGD